MRLCVPLKSEESLNSCQGGGGDSQKLYDDSGVCPGDEIEQWRENHNIKHYHSSAQYSVHPLIPLGCKKVRGPNDPCNMVKSPYLLVDILNLIWHVVSLDANVLLNPYS
jgi:hypothetical protein